MWLVISSYHNHIFNVRKALSHSLGNRWACVRHDDEQAKPNQ